MMDRLLKRGIIILFLLSLIISLKGQIFLHIDTIITNISGVTYEFLPVQSENNFNFLFYSTKNKKQNFELLTIKDTVIIRMEIKNKGLDGGGSWYQSAFIDNENLLLLHVDGFLVVYKKNKKGNYVLKETLNIGTGKYGVVSLLDNETVLLMNDYNYYTEKKLYANYALCVFNLQTKEILYSKEMDLGKGILFSHFNSTALMESKKNKIAVAHPTLPFIYIYNEKLEPIDTIHARFQQIVSVDSVINAVFTDSFIERNRFNPGLIIETIENGKIDKMERIEKVFWLSDDIVGYTICQPYSRWARIFVFYSISEKRELYKKIELYPDGSNAPYNFVCSKRVLINNNKTIWYEDIYEDDESDFYYEFRLYNSPLFNSTK